MSELSDTFLRKAQESLDGALSEFANSRYNNSANRCYYACFQAAVAALDRAGIRPTEGRAQWSHEFVQSECTGRLINRRKLYPSDLHDTLNKTQRVRNQADYKIAEVSQSQAFRMLTRTRAFVSAVTAQAGETS